MMTILQSDFPDMRPTPLVQGNDNVSYAIPLYAIAIALELKEELESGDDMLSLDFIFENDFKERYPCISAYEGCMVSMATHGTLLFQLF